MLLGIHAVVFIALSVGRFVAAEQCPGKDDIKPCECRLTNRRVRITCSNLQNSEELKGAVGGLKGRKIFSLEVQMSNLEHLPGDIFKGTDIEGIKFEFARMTAIGDNQNPPFTGLENTLKRLTIYEGFWDYDRPLREPIKLNHLKKLAQLSLINNIIPKLGDDWFQSGPQTLAELYITAALAEEIGDKAFATLENLRTLHFTGNSVTLKRSALPAKAQYLDSIDLSENKIMELPTDLFTKLPALKNVNLDGNGIGSLPESTWKSVLPQLNVLSVNDNGLVCDSKLKWILDAKLQNKIAGKCASPRTLIGRSVGSLKAEELSD